MAQIKTKYIADNAVTGPKFRLDNNTYIRSRNAANSADIDMFKVNASDQVEAGAALNMGSNAIVTASTVDGRDVSADGASLDAHLNGANDGKHDASEIDFEYLDASKKNINAASDDVESALQDLDTAIGALDQTPTNYTAADPTIVADHLAGIDTALAAASTDQLVKVSANDTTAGYVEDKFIVDNGTNSVNPLEASTINDGADEDYRIRFDQTKVDHGSIAGLADDDHTQYHNDTRGDARYHLKTDLASTSNGLGASLIGIEDAAAQYTATTVEGALTESLDAAQAAQADATQALADAAAAQADIDNHIADAVDAHAASAITNTPAGNISATTVQAAIDELDSEKLALAGGTMSGAIAMGTNKITGLGDPTAAQDAATKAYVDAVASGLDVKASVRALADSNTALTGGATLTIDGVSMANGDRVLLNGQTAGAENGIYVVSGIGSTYALTRSTDADQDAEVTAGMFTFVSEGTSYADSGWVLTTNDPITVDTTALAFSQFSGAGSITPGAGLTKTGNSIDVVAADTSINVQADSIAVNLAASSGLEVSSGLKVNPDSTNGTTSINGSDELVALRAAREEITLNGTDISNGYIDLAVAAHSAASISVTPDGGPEQTQASDYTISLTGGAGGVTRITFAGDLSSLAASGDVLMVKYERI